MSEKIKDDLLTFTALIVENEALLEFVVNNHGRSNYETAYNKLENAKNNIKEKMQKSSKEAKKYLKKQHELIQVKQNRLKARRDILIKRKEKQDKTRADIEAKQHQQQSNKQYDPNNLEHQELIKQYHHHKMAQVRAHKAGRQQPEQNVKEDTTEELETKKLIAAGRMLATNRRVNSEISRKNSGNNIRMSKQKMTTQAKTRAKF